ncbi:MAG: Prevent-host-death family protein [Candidatus Daviesbacteria bacterium GW2011_GWA2_38_24]|uniref:Antitoxin n=1 Tax=Candidatus Daviesbacteria bacterium GW2011_GWA2_38_24 TaxID=1618422 RepID=A0A0G0MM25_9BACT|nr:MAG: Prevent-host-death family protein [Candidatus Daviesbacteria bacterium GW2011_GWA2_38_24]KKQ80872.1 MAG: Prevent-host-death family protein [Candidatus Daviesbacteria bacterium GW2011_GWA1_38_7]
MSQVIPVTQARKDLLKLVDKVDSEYSRVDLTKNGKIKAALVSPDYLDSLEETIYSLKNSMSDIRKAEKEIAKGNIVSLEELEADLKKRQSKK